MIHIRLTEKCNYKCYFCHIPLLKPKDVKFEDIIKLIKNIDHKNPKVFCISGGEPTVVNYLYKLIKFIKMCNKNHYINIETNGFFLSNIDYTNKLINYGLDSILLSFHSHIPEIYNKITGISNGFDIIKKTFEVLNRVKLDVEISFVICNDNYNDLLGTINYLDNNLKYKGFLLSNIFEKINYEKIEDFHLKLKDIGNHIINAYDLLKNNGKEISSCGIPMCFLNGYEETYYLGQYDENRYYKKSIKCSECKLDNYCRGVIGDYGDIYGLGELSSINSISIKKINKLKKIKQEYLLDKDIRINNGLV